MSTKVTGTNRWIRDLLGYGFWLLLILSGLVMALAYCSLSFGPLTLGTLLALAVLWILLWVWNGLTFGDFWPWTRAR